MKKLKNFLYYEWKKILLVLLVLVLSLVTVRQCTNKIQTDLGVLYVSDVKPGDMAPLIEDLKKANIAKDVDSDGKITVKSRTILISSDEAINLEQQVPQQIQFEIISGENLLFLVNETTLNTHAGELSFADISEITKKLDVPSDKCRTYSDDSVFAVSLEGNRLIESFGINTKGMFIAQRNYLPKDKNTPLNNNARNALEYILSNY